MSLLLVPILRMIGGDEVRKIGILHKGKLTVSEIGAFDMYSFSILFSIRSAA
jgi:hypothetical protein